MIQKKTQLSKQQTLILKKSTVSFYSSFGCVCWFVRVLFAHSKKKATIIIWCIVVFGCGCLVGLSETAAVG